MATAADKKIPIVVVFRDNAAILRCSSSSTMAHVREAWRAETEDAPSVSFFSADGRFLPDGMTVAEAQQGARTVSLELHAELNAALWIELFGFEQTRTLFEVPLGAPPSAVRSQLVKALGLLREDFRLTVGGEVVDQEDSFEAQRIADGDILTVSPKMRVNLRSDEEQLATDCFVSETIGDLRDSLDLAEGQVIITTVSGRQLLSDSVRLCDVVSDKDELNLPIDFLIERKVQLFFQPSRQSHLRQEMLVLLSTIPLDMYDELSERFEETNEFRFTANSLPLKDDTPLIEQNVTPGTVIEIDIVWPPFETSVRLPQDVVSLCSTESAQSMNDGRRQSLGGVSFGDQVEERVVPFLSLDEIERRCGWIADLVMDVAPLEPPRIHKELMCHTRLAAHKEDLRDLGLTEETLVTVDPLKVVVKLKKRLHLCRLSRESTLSDIRTHVEQTLGRQHLMLSHIPSNDDREIHRQSCLGLFSLEGLSEFQTQIEVVINGEAFKSCFRAAEVTLTDVMINVAKQMKISPRQLFGRSLFCSGCGRRIAKEKDEDDKEDVFQKIPAACCRVRSLKLKDRRGKDIGLQTRTPRSRSVETETLYPEERDAAVNTDYCQRERIVIDACVETEKIVCSTEEMRPRSFRIVAINPINDSEEATVTIRRGRSVEIPRAARGKMKRVQVGDAPLMFWNEVTYKQYGKTQHAVQCYDPQRKSRVFVNSVDGSVPQTDNFTQQSRRFLSLNSRLPPALRLMPYLFLFTEPELFRVGDDRKPMPTLLNAVNDPAMIAIVMGIMNQGRLLVEVFTGKFVDIERIGFVSLLNEFFQDNTKRRIVILLADGDLVPHALLSKKDVMLVFRRQGVDLQVRNGRVYRDKDWLRLPKSLTVWDAPLKSGAFDKDFTAAARK